MQRGYVDALTERQRLRQRQGLVKQNIIASGGSRRRAISSAAGLRVCVRAARTHA
jgi:hypothetical protein